jgi:ABC-type Fe3+ transport system permease subunit
MSDQTIGAPVLPRTRHHVEPKDPAKSLSQRVPFALSRMDAFTPYWVLGVAVLLLAVLPLGRLLIAAFAPGLEAFWTEISRTASVRATANTFDVALWSSFLSLGLGGLLAFLVGATDMRGKRFCRWPSCCR